MSDRSAAKRGAAEASFIDASFEWKSTLYLIVPALLSLSLIAALCLSLPELKSDEKAAVLAAFPPRRVENVIVLRDLLLTFSANNEVHVMILLASAYTFMQTFCIPGSVALSLLAGALFGFWKGICIVLFTSAVGPSFCYYINSIVGRKIAYRIWPEKVEAFSREVEKRKKSMTNYIFFLRITPFLPNTFINAVSPVVGVPFPSFVIGTVLGTFPNNFIAVNAGLKLSELQSLHELYDPKWIIFMGVIGLVVLLPAVLAKPVDLSTSETEKKER